MKPTLRHLLALPLAIAVMASLGCDSSSSYSDADAQAPEWVANVAVSKAEITVTGMT